MTHTERKQLEAEFYNNTGLIVDTYENEQAFYNWYHQTRVLDITRCYQCKDKKTYFCEDCTERHQCFKCTPFNEVNELQYNGYNFELISTDKCWRTE